MSKPEATVTSVDVEVENELNLADQNDLANNVDNSNDIDNTVSDNVDNIDNVDGSDVVMNRAGDANVNDGDNETLVNDRENNLPRNENIQGSDNSSNLENENITGVDNVNTADSEAITSNSNDAENTENRVDVIDESIETTEIIENSALNNTVALTSIDENTFEIPDYDLTKISFDDKLGFNSDISNKWSSPKVEIVKPKLIPSHVVTLNIQSGYGIQYGLGFIPPSMRNTVGISWATTYGKLKRFELGLGLSASRNVQNNLGIEERVTVYDVHGGATRSWMKYQIKDAYYTGLDFNLSYNINNKHKILTSVTGTYLTAVRSNMSHQINADEITTVNDNWGAMEGLQKMDVLLGLGYQFNLGRAFAISIKGQYGLFDRTDNNFLGESLFDHETNVQLGLHYNIFTKH